MKQEHSDDIRGKEHISSLITAPELKELIGRAGVKIFDVRGIWGKQPRSLYKDYTAGHISGAVFLDWTKEFIEQGVALNLASVSSFEAAKQSFKNLGINQEDKVILYDDYYHMFAGRMWWAMRYWGFENVSVLNGGFKHWNSEGLAISTEIPAIATGAFEPQCQETLRLSLDDFLVQKDKACVLDGRGIEAYNGKPEDPRTGHIPGAISASYNKLVNKETGLFLEANAMKTFFDRSIPDWQRRRIISSCGAGYSGTVAMLALASLGISSSLFDGSFSVWKQDSLRAVEQGEGIREGDAAK